MTSQNDSTHYERRILDSLPASTLITRVGDGTVLFANQAAARLLGYPNSSALLGLKSPNFYWDAAERQALLESFRAKGSLENYQVRFRRADKTMIWVAISLHGFEFENEKDVLLSTIIDITERKQAEAALTDSTERFQSLYNNATIGLYRTTPTGQILMINPTGLRLLGFDTFEELAQRNLEEAGFEEDDARRKFREKLERDGMLEQESIWTRKDGTPIYVRESSTVTRDEKGNVLYYDGSFSDITAQKQAEKELQSEKTLSDAIINALPGPFFMLDTNGNLIRWNEAEERILEYSADELRNAPGLMTVVEEERKNLVGAIQKVFTEGSAATSATLLTKSGKRLPYLLTGSRLLTSTGTYLIGVGVDLTEQVNAAEALRQSQHLLQTVMDNIPQSVFWKSKDLRYLGANQAFAKDAGFKNPQDIVGKDDFEMPWKDQAELYRADDQKVLNTGATKLNYEEQQTNAAGETIWLRTSKMPLYDMDGNITSVLGIYEDITEQKKATEVLRESEKRFRTVVDFTYSWEYWLGTKGRFEYVSPACERISGYTVEEFEQDATLLSKIVHPEDHAAWDEHIRKFHTEHSERTAELDMRIINRQGETRWIGHVCQAVHDQEGKWQGRRASNRDITERKRLEDEVQRALERRGYQVQVGTEISQEIAAASNINDLFDQVVNLTKERLGYYHVQLLRYDSALDAVVLISGYGETGKKMLAAGHKLPMGSGLIGTAAAHGNTIMRSTLAADPDWQPNPLLPDTKGEIAVPIKFQNRILGVLDVQSNQAGALTEDDRLLLEGLCGQIAVAIEGTRLRQEMAERLEEVNRLYRTMSREGWEDYRKIETLPKGYVFDRAGIKSVDETDLSEELFAGVQMMVPGGETVGTLAVADDPQNPVSPEDRTFLMQVSEQVALALESARLANETKRSQIELSVRAAELAGIQGAVSEAAIIATTDVTGKIETVNENFIRISGYSREELIGQDHRILNSGYHSKEFIRDLWVTIANGKVWRNEVRNKTKNGAFYWVDTTISPILNEKGKPVKYMAVRFDITARKQAEELIVQRAAQLETVARVSSVAATIMETNKLLQEVANLTKELFNLYHSHVYLMNEAGDVLILAAGAGETGKQMVAQGRSIPLNAEQSLVARAARTKQGVIVNDVRSESGFLPHPLLPDTRAELAVPLIVGDSVLGVFDIQSEKINRFTAEDLSIQSTLASQIAVTLQNVRAFSQAQKQAERETTLNLISQKIQSATTVEAVLQIAARELGHALGAPMTIAQLSMKDKK